MPQAIPVIVGAIAGAAGATAVVVAAVEIAAALAVGFYEQDQAKKKARDNYNKSLQDRVFTLRSGVAARDYVCGTVRKGGALQYADSIGLNKTAFDSVVALANNTCEALAYYMGDEYIPLGAFPGAKFGHQEYLDVVESFTVNGPSAVIPLAQTPAFGTTQINGAFIRNTPSSSLSAVYGPGNQVTVSGLPNQNNIEVTLHYKVVTGDKLRVQFKNGLASQTSTSWGAGYISSLWDDGAHRLRGIAHMRSLMIWDDNIWTSGAPQTSAVLKGGPVDGYPFYDPRTGTNPTYTTNPAIWWGYWRTLPRSLGGMGVPSDWIDWQSVSIAANICDENIIVRSLYSDTVFDTVKRYECHTVLSTDATAAENEQIILSAMAGRRTFTGGKFRVVSGAFRPAALTITDAHVIGTKPITVVTSDPTTIPPNVVTARFADAAKNWIESEPSPVKNQAYIDADKHEEPFDISLPATTDARQANYLMGIELERHRPSFSVTMTIDGIGEDLCVFDTVLLSLVNRSAYTGKTFEITGIVDNWDGTFDATFSEIRATTFALDPVKFTPTNPTPTPDLSYLWNIPALTGFTVIAQTPTLLPDGTSIARILLSWDPPPGDYIQRGGHIEIRYRRSGSEWISGGDLPGDSTSTTITAAIVDSDAYQFQARAVSAIGAAGPWADSWQQITGTGLPAGQFIRLRATSTVFHVPASGSGVVSPSTITLNVDRQGGLISPSVWSTTPAVTLTGTADQRVLAYADMSANTVRVDVQITENGSLYVDSLTIAKLTDGAQAPDYIPDLTAPPTPTGFAVTAALLHTILTWDAPTYTVGHGPASTEVYGVKVPSGGPQPTFSPTLLVGGTPATIFSHQVGTGEKWAYWIKHKSKDGGLSAAPAGGTNGTQATTGKIGDTDLGPLIIQAGELASGAVTATSLAAGIIDATKFASSIEPVTNVTSVPTSKITNSIFNTTDRKLYIWNGSAYVLPAADSSGSIGPGAITTTMIAPGAITTPKIFAGAVTANELAANSVTAGKIFTNAVTAGTIAAGAVNTAALAAGAVTTAKLLVTGQGAALNDDPGTADIGAWNSGNLVIANVSDGIVGTTSLRSVTGFTQPVSRYFSLDPAKTYRVRCYARSAGAGGVFYLLVSLLDSAGSLINGDGSFWYYPAGNVTLTAAWAPFIGQFGAGTAKPFPSNARTMAVGALLNYPSGAGYMEVQDLRIEEAIPGSLIVDGAITATKISAGAIAVGSAAIQNGAIVNAMIANAAIDDAKIANLSAAKLTAGTIDVARIAAGTLTADKIGVLGTANLADAVITNAKIANLQVDNAKIANLAIGTTKIIDNAVTGAGSVSQGSPINVTNTNTAIVSLGYASVGGTISLQSKVNIQNPNFVQTGVNVTLLVDGSVVDSEQVTLSAGESHRFTCFTIVSIGAGSHTFAIQASPSGTAVTATAGAVYALEFKK
jgi:hypothetical protein